MHDVRTHRGQGRVIDAEFFLHAIRQIDDHHIHLAHNVVQHGASGVSGVIQRDTLLVAIDAQKPQRFAIQPRRPPGAAIVALAGAFDLDDLGTHVTEQHGGVRPGDGCRQVEHSNAFEQRQRRAAGRGG